MKYLLFSIILSFNMANLFSQELISKNSWFLDASPNSKYIIYFKSNIAESDEYIEGNIFIYDTETKTNSPLNTVDYMLNFIQVLWTSSNHFYLSNGSTLEYYNFTSNKKEYIYKTTEEEIINYFAVSKDNKNVALNIEDYSKNKRQKIIIKEIDNNKSNVIYSLIDSSIGENLRNQIQFTLNGQFICIKNIYNRLLIYNIKDKSSEIIDSNVKKLLFTSKNNLYYTKRNKFSQYDILSKKELNIFEGKNIDISYAGKYNKDDIAICLNDNIFLYNKKGKFRKVENIRKGKYVYIKNGIAIEELNNTLFINRIK
ncbi:MAG: hypothetical protein K9I94_13760 [Bacteroidales bacterium]|nr:hypothetical protein [Bacteroidales bacterium]